MHTEQVSTSLNLTLILKLRHYRTVAPEIERVLVRYKL